jgi:hypothetical protein
MSDLHPEVARFAKVLLDLELLLAEHNDYRMSDIRRCRIAAENSDAWSVSAFLSLFGYMGDFASAGLPVSSGVDYKAINRRFNSYVDEALKLARQFRSEGVERRPPANPRS